MGSHFDDWVDALSLAPHPEGGAFRETWRSRNDLSTPTGERQLATSILYALPDGAHSAWHRVSSDELWFHHAGHPASLHVISDGGWRRIVLGDPLRTPGAAPQALVPAGAWQACEASGDVLFGCVVAPGFDFADFHLATPHDVDALAARFRDREDHVRRLGPQES